MGGVVDWDVVVLICCEADLNPDADDDDGGEVVNIITIIATLCSSSTMTLTKRSSAYHHATEPTATSSSTQSALTRHRKAIYGGERIIVSHPSTQPPNNPLSVIARRLISDTE